jgi:hypothetical protein
MKKMCMMKDENGDILVDFHDTINVENHFSKLLNILVADEFGYMLLNGQPDNQI